MRKWLLALGVLILGLALVEAAARVRMHWKYGRATTEIYASRLDPVSGVNVPLPSQDVGFLHINEHGFRGPELPIEKPPGTLRLAFLGGSTTFCAEVSSDAATWPQRVTAGLAERLRLPCDYVNAALPGIGLKELRRILEHRVARFSPDVIVIYEATNDLARDTRLLADQEGLRIAAGDERSVMARLSVAWDLVEKNVRLMNRQAKAKRGEARLEYDADALAQGFRAELSRLVADARAIAPIVVLVTFSTRLREEQDEATRLQSANTSLYYMPYMSVPGLLRGFAAYNRAIREVARETGALLVEGEHDIPGDGRHFCDSVHFTDRGAEAQAARVLDALLESEALRAHVDRLR